MKVKEWLKGKFIDPDYKVKSTIPGVGESYFKLSDLLQQLLSTEPEAMGIIQQILEIANNTQELNMANYNHEEVNDLNNALIEIFQLSKLKHPSRMKEVGMEEQQRQSVDEPKQLLSNTTEGMSDQEIIEFSKREFMLGDDKLPHTVAESFCIRHGAKWMREKLTSNNQQTEVKDSREDLINQLEDVANELDLSEGSIEEHGPLGTPVAELVRLCLEQKDRKIRALKQGFVDIRAPQPQKADKNGVITNDRIVDKNIHPNTQKDSNKGAEEWLKENNQRLYNALWLRLDTKDYHLLFQLFNQFASKHNKEKCNCGGYPDCICEITKKD